MGVSGTEDVVWRGILEDVFQFLGFFLAGS